MRSTIFFFAENNVFGKGKLPEPRGFFWQRGKKVFCHDFALGKSHQCVGVCVRTSSVCVCVCMYVWVCVRVTDKVRVCANVCGFEGVCDCVFG